MSAAARTLDHIRRTPDAPLDGRERAYALSLHGGPAGYRRANALLSAVLEQRIQDLRCEPEGWQEAGMQILTSCILKAGQEGLLKADEVTRGLAARPATPDELLTLLLDTRAALDTRRRKRAMSRLTTADRVLLQTELRTLSH